MTDIHTGIGWTDYERYCHLLGLEPVDCSPVERTRRVPAWMCPELIPTEPAREKLKAWAQRTPRDKWDAPADPATVLVSLVCIGDHVLAHVTARTLAERLPAPVVDYLLTRVVFVALGVTVKGFCSAPLPAQEKFVVGLSAGAAGDAGALDRFTNVVGHEAAHAWLMPQPDSDTVAATSFWMNCVHDLPINKVPAAALLAVNTERSGYARDEKLAKMLAHCWGFTDDI